MNLFDNGEIRDKIQDTQLWCHCCNLTLYMKRMTGVIMIIDWGGPSLKSYLSFVVTICSNQFLFSHNKMSLSIIVCQGIPKQLSVQLVAAIIEKFHQNPKQKQNTYLICITGWPGLSLRSVNLESKICTNFSYNPKNQWYFLHFFALASKSG